MEGWGVVRGQLEKSFRKKLPSKSLALLGLNLIGFTDLFYKEISFHFLQGRFFIQPVT